MRRFPQVRAFLQKLARARLSRLFFFGLLILLGAGPAPVPHSQPVRSRWVQMHPAQSPSPRHGHAMAYDSRRQVVVLFGGCADLSGCFDPLNDTWEYDGTTWRRISTPTSPPARHLHDMVYDSRRGVVVLFGGCAMLYCDGALNDTWEYDGTNWVQVNTIHSPPKRGMHALAYDSRRGVVMLFGGQCNWSSCEPFTDQKVYDDTWEYDGTDWHPVTPDQVPPPIRFHEMMFDAARGLTVLVGGEKLENGMLQDQRQTWIYDGQTWQQGAPMPESRINFALTYDTQRDVAILFGGVSVDCEVSPPNNNCGDTWEYDGQAWKRVYPATSPSPRSELSMAYDSARQRAVLFGGYEFDVGLLGETWEYEILTGPPTTIYVDASNQSGIEDGSPEHPFNTIQEGIDAAAGGDIVSVAPGIYHESIVMKPTVIIRSQNGPEATIIDSEGASPVVTCGDQATLDGFTVTGAQGLNAFGIRCEKAAAILRNNIVQGNERIGIGLLNGSDAVVEGNRIDAGRNEYAIFVMNASPVIHGNQINGSISLEASISNWPQDFLVEGNVITGGTIWVQPAFTTPSGGNRIVNNWIVDSEINVGGGYSTFIHNTVVGGSRISLQQDADMEIVNNLVINATIENTSSGNVTVAYNDIFFGPGTRSRYIGQNGNISVDPVFVNPAAGDYHLHVCSPVIDAGTDVGVMLDIDGDTRPQGDGFDMGADEYTGSGRCHRAFLPLLAK